jgi:hypothetical protein
LAVEQFIKDHGVGIVENMATAGVYLFLAEAKSMLEEVLIRIEEKRNTSEREQKILFKAALKYFTSMRRHTAINCLGSDNSSSF